jgi:CRP-like cAMP-binding protein
VGIDEVLGKAPLFAALDDDDIASLRANTREVRVKRGEVIFNEGDSGDELFMVVRGKVKMGRTAEDGRESLLALLGPGDTFGEVGLFDPGPRAATATAVTDGSMLSIDNNHLRGWLLGRPRVAEALLQQVARRLRTGAEAMADLVFLDVPGRVAKALLDLSSRFGMAAAGGGIYVAHDLTQEELAQLVGASRETVNKALADFVNRGWIRLEARAVVILDVDRLRGRAD